MSLANCRWWHWLYDGLDHMLWVPVWNLFLCWLEYALDGSHSLVDYLCRSTLELDETIPCPDLTHWCYFEFERYLLLILIHSIESVHHVLCTYLRVLQIGWNQKHLHSYRKRHKILMQQWSILLLVIHSQQWLLHTNQEWSRHRWTMLHRDS